MTKAKTKGISVKKEDDFSQWYSELVQKADLADLRYNVKGFVVYKPWATLTIRKMYRLYEDLLEQKGHLPLIMPSVIPESNFLLESKHVKGFTPEVFWITHAGDKKLEEKLALRPTSETALYKMYSLWIRSYNDLPFKRYQSCQVWRAEVTKATRPFFRAREFHWIEAHNVFATEEDAKKQVLEDMETTYEMLQDHFYIPIIFFQRPEWDKFPGAVHTFAADALMESGKVIQLPSTHLLGTNFSKPFNVRFKDKDGKEKLGHITCYGPAISRIYGAMIALLGDDKGLVLPFNLAPVQVVIIPILFKDSKEDVLQKANEITAMLKSKGYLVKLDDREDATPGEKFNEWELKGVPLRIEIGPKDLEQNRVMIVDRNHGKQESKYEDIIDAVEFHSQAFDRNLKKHSLVKFEHLIVSTINLEDAKEFIENGKIVRCGFCSIDLDGENCAATIEKEVNALVRGKKAEGEKSNEFEKCIVCGKPAKEVVYIARSY